jgi:hypothetical protein
MHNLGTFHQATVDLFDRSTSLKRRDFLGSLFKLGGEKCVEYLGEDIKADKENFHFCRNEVMVASSCVLLFKANYQMGDIRNNVGLCQYEISLSKDNLKEKFENFPFKKMDDWLRDLSLSTKSFC